MKKSISERKHDKISLELVELEKNGNNLNKSIELFKGDRSKAKSIKKNQTFGVKLTTLLAHLV